MNIYDLDIPTIVKIARVKKGMNQSKFAEFMKVTQKTISNWEIGKTTPSALYLKKIWKIIES